MKNLNQLVARYLELNGIRMQFFAAFIGCEHSRCSRWLRGQGKLNPIELKRTHDFLEGKHIKTADYIMKE